MPRRKAITEKDVQEAARNLKAALLATTLEAASAQAAVFVVDIDDRQSLLSSLDYMRDLLRRINPEAVPDQPTSVALITDYALLAPNVDRHCRHVFVRRLWLRPQLCSIAIE